MGWAGGAMLSEELWAFLSEMVPAEHQQEAAKKVVNLFEDYDCDNLDECPDLIKAAGLENEYYGPFDEGENG